MNGLFIEDGQGQICEELPVAAAGSVKPQCADIGLPNHTGHISPAAWSQTVMMKSI